MTYQSYQSPYDEVEIKDTDYLVISARIKAMETRMLTRDKLEQMLEAKEDEDALKVGCGMHIAMAYEYLNA